MWSFVWSDKESGGDQVSDEEGGGDQVSAEEGDAPHRELVEAILFVARNAGEAWIATGRYPPRFRFL